MAAEVEVSEVGVQRTGRCGATLLGGACYAAAPPGRENNCSRLPVKEVGPEAPLFGGSKGEDRFSLPVDRPRSDTNSADGAASARSVDGARLGGEVVS